MTRPVIEYHSPGQRRHSRAGVASLLLSILAAMALVGTVLAEDASAPDRNRASEIFAILAFVIALAGFGCGLVGVRRIECVRTFAFVGVAQNAIVLLLLSLGVA